MGKKEDILRKVRLLLDKADSTTFESEADSLRQKADELMLRYAIESFEIDQARGDSKKKEVPILKEIEICYADNPIQDQLVQLMWAVAKHARCQAVVMPVRGKVHLPVKMKIVGFPADTEYAEMLFTSLWAQLSAKVEPKPDPGLSFEENVVMLMESGISRKRIAEMMEFPEPLKVTGKMTKIYQAWCEEHGKSTKRPLPITYIRNFATGFVGKVGTRLYEIRKRSQEGVGNENKYAIVLVDQGKEVSKAFREFFPYLKSYRQKVQGKFDEKARDRGVAAGRNADLGQPKVGGNRKALNR